MKKMISSIATSITSFLVLTSTAFAQELPKPDLSVWQSDKMKPVRDFANITIGIIFGIAVLYAVIMIAWYGIKLQSSGSDPMKTQEAKNGLKGTVMGVGITFAAIFVIGLILYVLGLVGIKGN
jgi:heme/copper-type cytochrome/quinol oxidase subunit 2